MDTAPPTLNDRQISELAYPIKELSVGDKTYKGAKARLLDWIIISNPVEYTLIQDQKLDEFLQELAKTDHTEFSGKKDRALPRLKLPPELQDDSDNTHEILRALCYAPIKNISDPQACEIRLHDVFFEFFGVSPLSDPNTISIRDIELAFLGATSLLDQKKYDALDAFDESIKTFFHMLGEKLRGSGTHESPSLSDHP